MKKISTTSPHVIILDSLGEKVVKKDKKRKDLKCYLRVVPQSKLLKLLDSTNIKHPKLIKNSFTYIKEEYIDGKPLINKMDRSALISLLCNYLYDMYHVDCTKIIKYSKWKNNSEFLYKNVDLLIKNFKKNKNNPKLETLGLNMNILLAFKNLRLDDQRRLTLIHGDFCEENLIEKNLEYYLVDWEQACYGDLAYELAIHFILENYSIEEQSVVIDRLSKSLGLNQTNLVRDIKIYSNFEILRKCFILFNDVINLKNKKLDYEPLLKKAYEYYFKLENPKMYEEIKSIL